MSTPSISDFMRPSTMAGHEAAQHEYRTRRAERAAVERLSDSDPFVAQYHGGCADCGGKVEPGDELVRHADGGYGHAYPSECGSTEPPPIGAREVLCSRCFCYHAGECA